MPHVESLECVRCGASYAPEEVEYTCPAHDGAAGVLDVTYDYEAIDEAFDAPIDGRIDSLWKYAPFLPVDAADVGSPGGDQTGCEAGPVSLSAGGTDLLDAPTLGAELGVETLVKREGANPTGSNKDRGSAVVVNRAVQHGHDVVACASTGNAAASLAGYAARAGLDCRIFVPADVPPAKAVQPRLYGATVYAVGGDYADAYDLCREVSVERGWYNRSAALNPYAVEGKRTLGYELAEQAPDADWVAIAMGNGCSLAGAWKGLREFERLGYLDDAPRMLGVQATGAAAIYERFEDGETEVHGIRVTPDGGRDERGTAADSIDVGVPHNAAKACRALAESDGDAVVVSDRAIADAQRLLGETEGLFVEPASAATVAGVRSAVESGTIDPDDRVVVVGTGNGLKDVAGAERAVDDLVQVPADPAAVPDE